MSDKYIFFNGCKVLSMKIILHIFPDEKFFDNVSDFFDSLDGIKNIYIFHGPKNYKFKHIKYVDKIIFFDNISLYRSYISNTDADIVYLHSMQNLSMFKYFRPDIKVIWWSWGYDIYNSPSPFSKPLVNIELYKPFTKQLIESSTTLTPYKRFKYHILKFIVDRKLRKAIARVDYYTPVLPIEYELMLKNKIFKAKPFRIDFGPGYCNFNHLYYRQDPENILIGNSFSPTNNHLDIFHLIKTIDIGHRKLIIPVNYGTGYHISVAQLKSLSSLKAGSAIWLEDFLPLKEYEIINKSVTHAIFGHVRQQAVGNHRMCIVYGVKMFFFKDSINYRYYKKKGFYVYSIEDDLNKDSLSSNLSYEQAMHNYKLLCSIAQNNKEEYQKELNKI